MATPERKLVKARRTRCFAATQTATHIDGHCNDNVLHPRETLNGEKESMARLVGCPSGGFESPPAGISNPFFLSLS